MPVVHGVIGHLNESVGVRISEHRWRRENCDWGPDSRDSDQIYVLLNHHLALLCDNDAAERNN